MFEPRGLQFYSHNSANLISSPHEDDALDHYHLFLRRVESRNQPHVFRRPTEHAGGELLLQQSIAALDHRGKPPNFTPTFSTGRLIAMCYGGISSSTGGYQSYDQLGRVTSSYQQTDSINYGFAYGYNLASEMTAETYPSGRQVITEYDTAGRAAGIRGAAVYYAGATASDATNRIQYAPQGAVSVMKLGNGKWEHTNFNNRLQPTQIGLGISGTDSSVMKLDYGYGTTANNGNVMSQIITAPSLTVNQCYGYDSLNRLTSAEEKSGGTACSGTQQWKQAFTYDRFGNRNFDLVNTTSNVLGPNPTISQSTNRIASGQSYGYDSVGNLTSDPTTPVNGIVYDAENRQTQYTKNQQATNYYYYDGDGHRIKKIDSTGTTVFVYNAGGQLIAEYTAGNPSSGGTSYLTSDHLGSTRLVIKSDGTTTRHDYLPFGEEIQAGIGGRTAAQGYVADSVRQKFTQKERDNESGLDYFLARYYSSAQGRFTSPDRPLSGQDEDDPQTWNLYGYTSNNPINRIDPDGERWFYQKNDKGKVTGVQWVNPNDDGSYTSPGDGWIEFVPREGNRVLEVFSPDGRIAYHFQENRDGSPSVFSYQTGKVEDATIGLVMDYLLGKAIGTVIGRAVSGFSTYFARRASAAAVEEAFEVASSGGRHSGFLKNYLARTKEEIRRGIKSIEKQIAKHEGKISNPEKHVEGWQKLDPRQQDALVNRKWPGDIQRQKEQLGILKEVLKRK